MVTAIILVASMCFSTILLIFSYVGYWTLTIRKALAVQLYRNQALGIFGIVLVAVFYYFFDTLLGFLIPTFGNGIEGIVTIFSLSSGLFYWIDSSMLAARRSDPISRDSFHWSYLRKALWILNTAVFAYLLILDLAQPFYTFGTPLSLVPFWVTIVSGTLLLPLVARRTKDITFRRNLKWTGLFFLTLVLSYPPSPFMPDLIPLLIITAVALVSGYCLYRSVRSFVKVYENEKFRMVNDQSRV